MSNHYGPQWVTTTTSANNGITTNPAWSNTPAWVTRSEYQSRLIDPRYYDQALAWNAANPKLTEHQLQRNKTMSTIAKIKAERQEKKERGEIEAFYEAYDNHGTVEGWDIGTIARLTWKPNRKDAKTYTYAAVYTDDERWHLTGSTPSLTVEEFVDWLVEKRIKHTDIEFFGPKED